MPQLLQSAEPRACLPGSRDAAPGIRPAGGQHALPEAAFRPDAPYLQAVLDHAQAVISVKDRACRYLFVNRRFEAVFARSSEEVLGKADVDLFRAATARALHAHDERVLAAGEPVEVEETVAGSDGAPLTFLSTKFPLRDAEGRIYALCSISTDISARIAAERALRESEARKAAVLQSALDAVITIDHEGTVVEVNAATERIFSYTAGEMVGRDMAELIVPPSMREAHRHGMRHFLATGQGSALGRRLELPAMRMDGSEFPIELAILPIALEGPPMFTGHIRDITERKEAERALRESRARYERITRNVPGMVYQFIVRKDGTSGFPFVSDGSRELFGCEPGAIEADAGVLVAAIVPEDRAGFQQSVLDSAGTLAQWLWEGRFHSPGGEVRWARCVSRPTREANGDTIWDGVVIDITDRKRAEEEAREARDNAERATRARDEFLSRMSHELRTPLNAILGFGQILERTELTARQEEGVEQIVKAGRHLLGLINEVLDLARIESGRLSMSPEPVEVAEVVGEALELMRPLFEERRLTLTRGAMPGTWVLADRQRLRQVLLNLLSNAGKYNCTGGTVEVRCAPAEAGRLAISVRDTGPGISAEQMEMLFVPFERFGAERDETEGTGIGLAISRKLMEAMGGSIAVESVPGRGSTFSISLPSVPAPAPTGTPHLPSGCVDPAPAGVARPLRRVLYVEDNPANLRLMETILEERGDIELLCGTRGDQALGLALEQRPELILLDLHLPGMSGETVLRTLRADVRLARTPVVIVSADALPRQIIRLRECGANDYLVKPLEVDEVLRVVTHFLRDTCAPFS